MQVVILKTMVSQFHDRMRALGCENKKIVVAFSGGLDSTVLLHLLSTGSYPIIAAHANFCLRGSESDGDEESARQFARSLNIECHARRFNTKKYAESHGVSVQMAARELRYEWFDQLRSAEGFDVIATAHHGGDQVETVLLNLIRGTGISGLTGIPESARHVIRPLLSFTRDEIRQYADSNHLSWREDSSNSEDHYTRNYLRLHVIPRLRELNPSLEDTIGRNAERLQNTAHLASVELERLSTNFVITQGNRIEIAKKIFTATPHPAAVLFELIGGLGFNIVQCHEIVESSSRQPGKMFYTRSHVLNVDREKLIVLPLDSGSSDRQIDTPGVSLQLGDQVLSITSGNGQPENGKLVIDQDKVKFPMTWRYWKAGDSFYPLGMDHHKKISDFLVDMKMSRVDKERVTVLVSGDEIVCVVGLRVDNRYRITPETKRTIVIATSPG